MAESPNGDKVLRLEEQVLIDFSKELQEYRDSYHELVFIDGFSGFVESAAQIVGNPRANILLTSDTSGLKRRYNSLVDFENKYPFLPNKLSLKALELKELKPYLS